MEARASGLSHLDPPTALMVLEQVVERGVLGEVGGGLRVTHLMFLAQRDPIIEH